MHNVPHDAAPGPLGRPANVPSRRLWDDDDAAFPPIGDQCRTEACAAWAAGYAYMGWLLRRRAPTLDLTLPEHQVSPTWLYTMLSRGDDSLGTSGLDGVACVLVRQGAPWRSEMPVSCDATALPTLAARSSAKRQRCAWKRDGLGFRWLPTGPNDAPVEGGDPWEQVWSYLAKDGPLLVEMSVGPSFADPTGADWVPTEDELRPDAKGWGQHDLVCVGYDDEHRVGADRGALRFRNSYGPDWRDRGSCWISYRVMQRLLASGRAPAFGRLSWNVFPQLPTRDREVWCKRPTEQWRFQHVAKPSPEPQPRYCTNRWNGGAASHCPWLSDCTEHVSPGDQPIPASQRLLVLSPPYRPDRAEFVDVVVLVHGAPPIPSRRGTLDLLPLGRRVYLTYAKDFRLEQEPPRVLADGSRQDVLRIPPPLDDTRRLVIELRVVRGKRVLRKKVLHVERGSLQNEGSPATPPPEE